MVQGNSTALEVDASRGRCRLVLTARDLGVESRESLVHGGTRYEATGDGEADAVLLNATATIRRTVDVPADVSAGVDTLTCSVPDSATPPERSSCG